MNIKIKHLIRHLQHCQSKKRDCVKITNCLLQKKSNNIQKLIDEEPQVTVTKVVDALITKFEDFFLSKTQVNRHMKTPCNPSVSVPQSEPEK
ncbi:hypothetical protein CLU79DRAFT_770647 [Phycomyces nitens]|nr:hypothetical protein CLU79DRAFT_770647 [Phycomyces nitens]